ncbi:MAG: hypothetical protein IMW98_04215 [Firmicutes bacterium]|nr:hypothetical protein [Bacillota bacterium]
MVVNVIIATPDFDPGNGWRLMEDTAGTVSPGDVWDGATITRATLTVTIDKPTIAANGTDTATVTAQVSDDQWSGDVLFEVAGQTYVVPASGGKATFTVSSTTPGDIAVRATPQETNPATGTPRWGSGSVTIHAG